MATDWSKFNEAQLQRSTGDKVWCILDRNGNKLYHTMRATKEECISEYSKARGWSFGYLQERDGYRVQEFSIMEVAQCP